MAAAGAVAAAGAAAGAVAGRELRRGLRLLREPLEELGAFQMTELMVRLEAAIQKGGC